MPRNDSVNAVDCGIDCLPVTARYDLFFFMLKYILKDPY